MAHPADTLREVRYKLLTPLPTGHRLYVLDVPYEWRALGSRLGASWDTQARAHTYIGPHLPIDLIPFKAQAYSWEQYVEDEINDDWLPPFDDGGEITPRPHQQEAADAITEIRRLGGPGYVLADDVGLGKTIAAIRAAQQMPEARLSLIVCPIAVVAHWRRILRLMGTGDKRFVVIHYDALKRLLSQPEKARDAADVATRNRHVVAEGQPLVEFDTVFFDEAHLLRWPDSQRSIITRRIADGAFTVWMSATAGQNPAELSYLSPLLSRITGTRIPDPEQFADWCAARGMQVTAPPKGKPKRGQPKARPKWQANDDDLNLVRRWLFDPANGRPAVGIRRRPQDLAGWKVQQRFLMPITMDAQQRALYEGAWTEFRRELGMAERGDDPRLPGVIKLRFRQKCSLLRAPGTAELVKDMLDNGRQVAVSVEFLESLEAIRTHLAKANIECAVIQGGMNPTAKEDERLAFQRGDKTVILFTVKEGVSFHAGEQGIANDVPRLTLVHDPRYSGLDSLQIEGRCHRDGQAAPAYYLYGEDTAEEKVVNVLVGRLRSTKAIQGDDTTALEEMEAALSGRLIAV